MTNKVHSGESHDQFRTLLVSRDEYCTLFESQDKHHYHTSLRVYLGKGSSHGQLRMTMTYSCDSAKGGRIGLLSNQCKIWFCMYVLHMFMLAHIYWKIK